MQRSAVLSPCRRYRFELWRTWGDLLVQGRSYAMFVGLNPSTADETQDDPTIRRCIDYAKRWGYSGLCVTNLFAWRATKPEDMLAEPEPIGPANDEHLIRCAASAGVVIAAWGAQGVHMGRDANVKMLLPRLAYLRLTKDGYPGHPLYLPKALQPQPFEGGRMDLERDALWAVATDRPGG